MKRSLAYLLIMVLVLSNINVSMLTTYAQEDIQSSEVVIQNEIITTETTETTDVTEGSDESEEEATDADTESKIKESNVLEESEPIEVVNALEDVQPVSIGYFDGKSDWIALTSTTDISAGGNYYLAEDITLTKPLTINASQTVNLCLNNHVLTNVAGSAKSIITVNGTLNLYDINTYDDTVSMTARYWNGSQIVTGTSEDSSNSCNFSGGVITGGACQTNFGGGAIYVSSNGVFNQYGGNIVGNQTTNEDFLGAGVYVAENAAYVLEDGAVIGNISAGLAGGIYVKGSFVMNGGVVAHNATASNKYGGGLYNGGGSIIINDGLIDSNTAMAGGGLSAALSTTIMNGGTISNNYTTGSTAGVFIAANSTFTMTGGTIEHNRANGFNGGVGLRSAGAVFYMTGGTIQNNTSVGVGAGVYMATGTFNLSGSATILNNTYADTENTIGNNVYLEAGQVITVTGNLENQVGVAKADGTGTVAISNTNPAYSIDAQNAAKIISDNSAYYRVLDGDAVLLVEEGVIPGNTVEKSYQDDAFPIADLGLFDLTGLGEPTYTVKIISGEATLTGTGADASIDVTSIGSFEIAVRTSATITSAPMTGTATLTVIPMEVTISDLKAITRGPEEGNRYVTLDETSGVINGAVSGDDVSIYYTDAIAMITNEQYDDDPTLNTVGSENFDVQASGLKLTGADSGNYTLVKVDNTTVTINMAIPYIAWPSATNISYGQDQKDSELVGGKVIVKEPNGDYVEVSGTFVWTGTETNEKVGTYTHEVKFEETDPEDSDTYRSLLDAARRDVSYQVLASPVKFTVTDNSKEHTGTKMYATISADAITIEGEQLVEDTDYTITYTQYKDNAYVTIDEPTEVGTYFVNASFLNTNYYHAGATVNTGKQIGVFTIYAKGTDIKTYTVTFYYPASTDNGDKTIIGAYTIADSQEQDIHILPTLSGNTYIGWKTEQGAFYEFGSRFPQPAYDVVLTAVKAPEIYNISGTITGTDLDGTANTCLSGIGVVLMQGTKVIATTETDANGTYSFSEYAGLYTVVATRDQGVKNVISKQANIQTIDLIIDFVLPDLRQNTVLKVGAGVPDVTVIGLEDLLAELAVDEENTFTLYVDTVDIESEHKAEFDAIMAVAKENDLTTDNLKLFLDISLTEQPLNQELILEESSKLLAINIPLSGIYQDKDEYVVYRYDNEGKVEILTTDSSQEEYFEISQDGLSITLHIKEMAMYGIGFPNSAPEVLQGISQEIVYGSEAIDITTIGLFDTSDLGEATYRVTQSSGTGTFDSDANMLKVSSVGTFLVTIETKETSSAKKHKGTACLTITPLEVMIEKLEAIERGPIEGNRFVELDESKGDIVTIINSDDVHIDFTNYQAQIKDDDYDDDPTLNTAGTNTFGVDVSGLKLSGTDSGNYTLTSIEDTTVTINMAIPYIAWPTATDILYGQTQTDSHLNGGKVIIKEKNGVYKDITGQGEFEWVTSGGTLDETVYNTGIKSYKVQFVEANNDSTDDYHGILKTTDQLVNYTILAAPVTFHISDNMVLYGDAVNPKITTTSGTGTTLVEGTDYNILYYQFTDSGLTYVKNPLRVGTYFIGAEFITHNQEAEVKLYNYHHTGTQESTAKQIGVLTIYAEGDVPTTYTTSFTGYTGTEKYDITGSQAQDIHILPTLTGDDYIGWESALGIFYNFGSRFPQPAYDVTFTAVSKANNHTISGTIKGTDLNGVTNTTLSNISVILKQGATIVEKTTTNESGVYSFSVMPDRYTLEVTRDQNNIQNAETVSVDATSTNVTKNFDLPDIRQNVVLEVAAGMGAITVDGLDTLLTGNESNTITVLVDQVDVEGTAYAGIMSAAQTDNLTQDNVKLFLDIHFTQQPNTDVEVLDDASSMLTFYIPLSGIYQGKEAYKVYMYDESEEFPISVLTSTPNSEGEKMQISNDGKTLIITTKKSAVYALAFTEPVDSIVGIDAEDTYQRFAIDITTLGMFDLEGLGSASYTLKELTGKGSFVGTKLDVTKAGTFEVTVTTMATETKRVSTGTAILTILPKEVAIEKIVSVSRRVIEDKEASDYLAVELDTTSGSIIGLINNDTVTIDFTNGTGTIQDVDYSGLSHYDKNGIANFDLTVKGLTLSGMDASNYVLKSIADSDVDITRATATITEPIADQITYGETLTEATLSKGSVVVTVINASGVEEQVTLTGSFVYVDDTQVLDVGTHTVKVKFVEDMTKAPTDTTYRVWLEAQTFEVDVVVTQKEVTITEVESISRRVIEDKTATDYLKVVLDSTTGKVNGVLEQDDVIIDFKDGTGTIQDSEYTTLSKYNENGIANFDVTVKGLTLSGTDASNYVLKSIADSDVDITRATATITEPIAEQITYGETLTEATLSKGSVVVTVINASGVEEQVTLTGSFVYVDDTQALDAGTHTVKVKFVEDQQATNTPVDTTYRAWLEAETFDVEVAVGRKGVTLSELVAINRGPVEGDDLVALDDTKTGKIEGMVVGDDLKISYKNGYGKIKDANYTDYMKYDADGKATFDVLVGGLELSGTDKANYYIVATKDTTVTISIDIPFIAWPTAPDINYHENLEQSTLYGGKVIVLDSDTGEYVEIKGNFEWVNETVDAEGNIIAQSNIGTYTQCVRFVEDTTSDTTPTDISYRDLLNNTTHEVEFVIKATSVKFNISNNDVVYTGQVQYPTVVDIASSGKKLTQDEFSVQYFKFIDGKVVYFEQPTEVGTYYIACEFSTNNYHHAGTLEYTGKQVGVFNIYESEPTTSYTVTFEGYSDLTIERAYDGDIHILPTITDENGVNSSEYIAWAYDGSVYNFGARFPQPKLDVVFTPVKAPETYTLSASVYGEDLNGDKGVALNKIGVAIMQGSEMIANGETNQQGQFSFDLPVGHYMVVVTRDQVVHNEISIYVEVSNQAIILEDIILPDTAQNIAVEIASNVSVIGVDGLDAVLQAYLNQDGTHISNTITAKMNPIDILITEKTQYDEIMKIASKEELTTDNLKLFFDMTVLRDYDGGTHEINTIPNGGYLEFYVPLSGIYQGKDKYQIYRYHTNDDGTTRVDVITDTENEYGEKFTLVDDGKTLKVKAKYYSIYGIAFFDKDVDEPTIPVTPETTTPETTTPETTTPEQSGGEDVVPDTSSLVNNPVNVPQTGDFTNSLLWLLCILVCTIGMALTRKKEKDTNPSEREVM